MNPTFSSAKIREVRKVRFTLFSLVYKYLTAFFSNQKMGPLIEKCIDRLIEQFENKLEEEISINMYMKRFTMDTIWNCAFGLDIDLQNDPENPYLINSNSHFKAFENFSLFTFISCNMNFG